MQIGAYREGIEHVRRKFLKLKVFWQKFDSELCIKVLLSLIYKVLFFCAFLELYCTVSGLRASSYVLLSYVSHAKLTYTVTYVC